MKQMTEQEFFDKTLNALRAQGKPGGVQTVGGFRCEYRADNGTRCAAGLHITDEQYIPGMEGLSVIDLAFSLGADHPLVVNADLAQMLQEAHDEAARLAARGGGFLHLLEESFDEVAAERLLDYAPPASACP